MDLNAVGRIVILVGIGLVVGGALLVLFSRVPGLKNLGNLPGDIHIQGENFSCFFPIATMIILSILLSVGLNLAMRFFNR